MDARPAGHEARSGLHEILGYLNFSSGSPDVRFQRNVAAAWEPLETPAAPPGGACRTFGRMLHDELRAVAGRTQAFNQVEQAEAVLSLVFDHFLPAYREFHRDLLYHQDDDSLLRPFFVVRACEAVLKQGPPWDETARVVGGALGQLNDFVGHRPVAVLHTTQAIQPYAHERVRPGPLYLRGAGVAVGKYRRLVEQALAHLADADRGIRQQAGFDLDLVDELALDPRAYDFDHPADKRPNYQFGQWDPHCLDLQGRYRRFVLQEVTLHALWERTQAPGDLDAGEVLYEAGAILAGVILMASGTSGSGPDAHDSGTTLATLVTRIAAYRDAFYKRLLEKVPGSHGARLRAEAVALHQPFGGARQDLNQRLAPLRAVQLQHVHLAQVFARMGYAEAAGRQARIVPVASARMLCEISGRLTAGQQALDRGQVTGAADLLPEIEDLLHRGIECGALVDPWNILGFQAQFSLFPALENSVRDHRVDVLIHLVSQLFGLHVRLRGEAAARGELPSLERLSGRLESLARWWDRFATLDVAGVEHVSGREAVDSAEHVAAALGAWREAGSAAGDIAFWRKHVERFNSPKAYALVINALLEQRDYVASMALLVQWLGRAEQVPLVQEDHSLHRLALDWLERLVDDGALPAADRWGRAVKFFDYLEANAEEYWEIPALNLPGGQASSRAGNDAEEWGAFGAAYEEMTWRDSTDDGYESEMLEEAGPASDFELDLEAERLEKRLAFLTTLARLWKLAIRLAPPAAEAATTTEPLGRWFGRAVQNRRGLFNLLHDIHRYPLPAPSGTHETLVEYDRRRRTKEAIVSWAIAACVETSDAARWLLSAAGSLEGASDLAGWEQQAVALLEPMRRGDVARVRAAFPALRAALDREPILYVPLARGGAPAPIVGAKTIEQLLLLLLGGLPRLGLLRQARRLIGTAQAMERHRPKGDGAVTEFDRLFETGYRALVETLVRAAGGQGQAHAASDAELIDQLQTLTESLLKRWLSHSRSLRLSVLEKVSDQQAWNALVRFIERFGREIFTPRFMNLGNLRTILHQTPAAYLSRLREEADDGDRWTLLDELDRSISGEDAARQLGLAVEAVAENYAEFRDFNSTTTQSDRGDLLFILLDFLRLKAGYDRFAWNIKPVILAHEVLVRRGRTSAAELWRLSVARQTSEVADWHLQRLGELERKYGLRLPAVADRLSQRFVRPLAIDRVRVLVRPAVDEARRGAGTQTFALLEQQLAEFIENPAGSGADVPGWLAALGLEVDLAVGRRAGRPDSAAIHFPVPRRPLSWTELQGHLRRKAT